MTARAFALMIIAVLIGAMAAGTASDIDNCCYVNRQCSTDQDWVKGYHAFQNNQCSAPAQSQPAGGATAQIDNCCTVDRQCNTDQDWINGWQAYQNNQCGAAPQSQAPRSSQPTGGVPAHIDNCCTVDRQCNTNQDWINGWQAYANNQCGAPAQSPAPASSQPIGGAPAHIDNCCHFDRQCNTNQDWINGWQAYRNNQCGAPTTSQPTGGVPAHIDNCCHFDRQCHSEQDWINGWQAYRYDRCGTVEPSSVSSQPGIDFIHRTATGVVIGKRNGRGILPSTRPLPRPQLGQTISYEYDSCCNWFWDCDSSRDRREGHRQFQKDKNCSLPGLISIVGEPDFINFYAQRLAELKNKVPHRYDYVLSGLLRIEQGPDNLLNPGVDRSSRQFSVGWGGYLTGGWEKRRSAVLVHEACHIHRHDQGYTDDKCTVESQRREEVFCREMELQVVIELGTQPDVTEWVRGMVESTRAGEYDEYMC